MGWDIENSYSGLPKEFFSTFSPVTWPVVGLYTYNDALGASLGLPRTLHTDKEWAKFLSGVHFPEGAHPISQAYAGHQFGHFTLLGDGRAVLLGEQVAPDGKKWDVQLKGAGITPYSRRGDGRATLSAMLREYLMSEAVHGLGIPTSRSLAIVTTGEKVPRERIHDGAILTRIASSHIRVGTFEFARKFTSPPLQEAFFRYTIGRHDPELLEAEKPVFAFLEKVMDRQIKLVVDWMRVGFIHGVMNTDNMTIAGETIDYGPCAFMNSYHPGTVFSSIDSAGRYAYGNQPNIAAWNLAVLANALLPLAGGQEDRQTVVDQAQTLINSFSEKYHHRWLQMMRGKLGWVEADPSDRFQIEQLLDLMMAHQMDYTNTFRGLSDPSERTRWNTLYPQLGTWLAAWQRRIAQQAGGWETAQKLMQGNNPVVIPRNHIVEEAIESAINGERSLMDELLVIFQNPYSGDSLPERLLQPPPQGDADYQTFCGT
jgi:uncharacterized protein YdiU (UPF0061 family)